MENIKIVWHKSAEEILRNYWEGAAIENGLTIEDIITDGEITASTVCGSNVCMKFSDMVESIIAQKGWGFSEINNRIIHMWVSDDATPNFIMMIIGHEIGHLTGKPNRNNLLEEQRADDFGFVAAKAYEFMQSRNI